MIDRRGLRVVVAATAAMLVLGQVAVGSAARLTDRAHAALPTAACGSTWSPVPSPSVFNTHGLFNWNALLSASATSASDVWAVGEDADATVYVAIGRTLTMHWDGTSWTPVKAVEVAGGNTYLSGVVAVAPNLVYAVGASKSDKVRGALIEAYDGSAWSVSRLPTIGSQSVLFSVAASGAKDVWA
ncbi:MAG: hypothetical protein M3N98_09740, partial [Actinomycetota bacterium]|nr:hypothetical protein [Actinomycetota bacterium]